MSNHVQHADQNLPVWIQTGRGGGGGGGGGGGIGGGEGGREGDGRGGRVDKER